MLAPKITIVTPSYNQAQFLDSTIKSVLAQDYPHLEYIVVDGGSTDGSAELIQGYEKQLAFWCSERDQGQADAIAKGFDKSSGEIMGWLNSDDLLLPGTLTAVANYFQEHPEVDVVSGGAYCIDSAGRPLRRLFGNYTLGVAATYKRFLYYEQDGVFQQATFWRRAAYDAVGGLDRSLHFVLDRDLFLRLARRKRFGRLNRMLACFRIHDDCKSVRIQDVRAAESQILAKKYGTDQQVQLLKQMLYYRYRLPSVVRKAWLAMLLGCGVVRLERTL
jgi:glycosyltransferase involved in cell wall biosynthesis